MKSLLKYCLGMFLFFIVLCLVINPTKLMVLGVWVVSAGFSLFTGFLLWSLVSDAGDAAWRWFASTPVGGVICDLMIIGVVIFMVFVFLKGCADTCAFQETMADQKIVRTTE